MAGNYRISDMYVLELKWGKGFMTVIKESDHLLRRFGQVDVVRITPDRAMDVFRHKADEIWAILSGRATITLEDQRDESPSRGEVFELEISDRTPKAVLVPFGVACKVSSTGEALFLRIGTHQDFSHPEDRTVFL